MNEDEDICTNCGEIDCECLDDRDVSESARTAGSIALNACKIAYRKHVCNDESIGWEELAEILRDALCEIMGDDEFVVWLEKQ